MGKGRFSLHVDDIVSNEEMKQAFANANFGSMPHREVLKQAVMKCAGHYYQGFTSTQIIEELGLRGKNGNLTKKGGRYLYAAWEDGSNF